MSPMDTIDNGSEGSRASAEKNQDRDVATMAQLEYERDNFVETRALLSSLNESKALHYNQLITQFGIDSSVDTLLAGLITSEDLDLDQQVLIDYNRALALAKYRERYDEAMDLLETRMSVMLESIGLVDERLSVKVCLLLAILYMERKKDPTKALSLLQFITDKCDVSCQPPRLQQLKAKCYLQLGSTKSAKRELKSISGEPLVRTCLELQRSNFKKAMKIFSGSFEDVPMFHNNEALIQYGLGKKNTAVYHMIKAAHAKSPEILYNLAVMHLFTGNTKSAEELFRHLVVHLRHNPRVWFRLAECTLEQHCKTSTEEFDLQKNKQHVVQKSVGQGIHRKIVFNASNEKRHKALDKESLIFARGCLLNSLTVLNSRDCSFYPSNYPSEVEHNRFKIAVFLSLSYVNLKLRNFSPAYTFAKAALKLDPKGHQKALANLYAGEALVWLDQISEAIIHFSPDHAERERQTGDEPLPVPPATISSWYPDTARYVLLYNLAVAYCLRGELDRASETLRQVSHNPNYPDAVIPVQVVSLSVYINLQQGYLDAAKSFIRQHLPQYR